jgi:hypothetical protein
VVNSYPLDSPPWHEVDLEPVPAGEEVQAAITPELEVVYNDFREDGKSQSIALKIVIRLPLKP